MDHPAEHDPHHDRQSGHWRASHGCSPSADNWRALSAVPSQDRNRQRNAATQAWGTGMGHNRHPGGARYAPLATMA